MSTSCWEEDVKQSPPRVRFAPSPTGSLHVGGARTAIFNWLFARKYGGKFIVRVEDTDQARSTRASEESIMNDLKWLGLDVDEGPDLLGGDYGPYRQSERKEIYQRVADQLVESGHAYRCFCTSKELEDKKNEMSALGKPNIYDGRWRDRDPKDIEEQLKAGTPYTVRFKIPNKQFFIDDIVRGRIAWDPRKALDDFVIMRSNGMPVYNFCVAIDDYLMKISHVIRAEEHLSNTIKQILIFDAIEAKHPVYGHCSLILGSDKTKLSKRHGAASLSEFAAQGYLPSAMRNYLGMLGWASSGSSNKEVFTSDELVEAFDPNRIVRSAAQFDTTRLTWMNGKHIELMPPQEYKKHCEVALRNSSLFPLLPLNSTEQVSSEVVALENEFVEIASNLAEGSIKFFADVIPYTKTILQYPFTESQHEKRAIKVLKTNLFVDVAHQLLQDYNKRGDAFPPPSMNPDVFSEYMNKKAEGLDISPSSKVFFPTRLALTGSISGPHIGGQLRLIEVAEALLNKHSMKVKQELNVDITPLKERMQALEAYLKSQNEE